MCTFVIYLGHILTSQKFCYLLPYFSTLEGTYESVIFPYLQKQGISMDSTHINVVT